MIRKTALQLGVAALFTLIVWNGYIVVNHVAQMQKIAALTAQSSTTQTAISAVMKDLTDMEAGQRGYLLTDNASYLQPYTEANDRLGADFSTLRKQLGNRDQRQESLESQAETLIGSKQSEMERSIALRKQGYRHRALKLIDSNESIGYMDQAREYLSAIMLAQNNRLGAIEAERSSRSRELLKKTVFANLALLALVAGVFLLVRYHMQALERKAAQSAQQLASHDLRLAKFMYVLSHEASSKTSAIEANVRLLIQEYGGFLPRHACECAEHIEEASAQLEQLRQELVGESRAPQDEPTAYEFVA